jgi:hypothetical protein
MELTGEKIQLLAQLSRDRRLYAECFSERPEGLVVDVQELVWLDHYQ